MKNEEVFYKLQESYMNNDANKEDRRKLHESWFNESTVDFWRHKRMYETISSVAKYYNNKKWISIGDGRYGLDSFYLNKLFNIDVFPTDIAADMLAEGKKRGLYKNYSVENAESLSFKDKSFDIVFCKESFHHFPRPIIALYEMIRISRIAVILIEPNDQVTFNQYSKKKYVKSAFKILLSKIFNKDYQPYLPNLNEGSHFFEESGNYVYTLSLRELNKITHAIDLGGLAWKGFNDQYIEGCEFEIADDKNAMFKKIKESIIQRDNLCIADPSLYNYGMITVVLFINTVQQELATMMKKDGYIFGHKELNPIFNKR